MDEVECPLTHPELFSIISPVDVEVLGALTSSHLNKPFVQPVLEGLREGFWPWAITVKDGYPLTWDELKRLQLSPEKEEFLNKQLEHKVSLGRVACTACLIMLCPNLTLMIGAWSMI